VRDLDQIRAFLTGAGPIAIVDLPWIPVFLLICFLIHPWLGLAATVGGIVLFTMALLTERASRTPARTAAQDAGMRSIMVEATRRGGETIVAMGMSGSLAQRWAPGLATRMDFSAERRDRPGCGVEHSRRREESICGIGSC
jgi:ATP-binding cassette subfamily C protein